MGRHGRLKPFWARNLVLRIGVSRERLKRRVSSPFARRLGSVALIAALYRCIAFFIGWRLLLARRGVYGPPLAKLYLVVDLLSLSRLPRF